MHTDPTAAEMGRTFRLGDNSSIDYDYFQSHVLTMYRDLADELWVANGGHGEMEWHRRLDLMNHSPYMPPQVTVVGDSVPYYMTNPTSAMEHYMTRSGKYGRAVGKSCIWVTVGSNLPVAELGLFLPKLYDGHLVPLMDSVYPRHPHELILGDGHFRGPLAVNCMCPPTNPRRNRGQPPPLPLTQEQRAVVGMMQLARAPVEPVMQQAKLPKMFHKQGFRGEAHDLQMWYKVHIHMRARDMYITADAGHQRHRMYGPYPHFN